MRHKLLRKDTKAMTGVCAVCGNVRLKKKSNGFRCLVSENRWKSGKKSTAKSLPRVGSNLPGRYRSLCRAARVKGKGFDITVEQHTMLLLEQCSYCGGPLSKSGSGLDRMDSSLGYLLANVAPCCGPCNVVKSNILTYEEMKVAMAAVTQLRTSKCPHL